MKILVALAALKPSEYRDYVKGWDKDRLKEEFGGKNRIYIPFKIDEIPTHKIPKDIYTYLVGEGYTFDYLAGVAMKDGRTKRIGKVLPKELLKQYEDDGKVSVQRDSEGRETGRTVGARAAAKKDYWIVISRHPYDIAGMGTDRGWKSCFNLRTGTNVAWVKPDTKHSIVAYVVEKQDRNIKNPISRVIIRPHVNRDLVVWMPEPKAYGQYIPAVHKVLGDWLEKTLNKNAQDGYYELHPELYRDGRSGVIKYKKTK